MIYYSLRKLMWIKQIYIIIVSCTWALVLTLAWNFVDWSHHLLPPCQWTNQMGCSNNTSLFFRFTEKCICYLSLVLLTWWGLQFRISLIYRVMGLVYFLIALTKIVVDMHMDIMCIHHNLVVPHSLYH
jgi:hypothetical protein